MLYAKVYCFVKNFEIFSMPNIFTDLVFQAAKQLSLRYYFFKIAKNLKSTLKISQ